MRCILFALAKLYVLRHIIKRLDGCAQLVEVTHAVAACNGLQTAALLGAMRLSLRSYERSV